MKATKFDIFNKKDFSLKRAPLSFVLVVPFVLQIFVAVSLVGYLSFKNSQRAVNKLAKSLSSEVSSRVDQHLDNYLILPHQLIQLSADSLETDLLNLKDFRRNGRYFWERALVYPNIAFIGYYLQNGEGVAAQRWPPGKGINIVQHSLTNGKDYNYATDAKGNRTTLIDATEYFAPQEQWYIDAVKANKPIWSRIYTAEGFPGYVAASAVRPLYSKSRQIIGVLGVDLLLTDISRFLHDLSISPNGKVFILERNGLLIADSGTATTYKVVRNKTHRLSALDSADYTVKVTAQYLKKRFGDFKEIRNEHQLTFSHNQQQYFTQVLPWSDQYGLDWLVVVTIPESDFMGEINANNRLTILLCMLALFVAILIGTYTSRWITRPILKLNQASQAIASGNFNQQVQVEGIKELVFLSQAFNRMAQQLKDSFDLLETRVVERTTQLAEAKEAADSANQAKSQFLASMSHELRTPLNAILGFTQILQHQENLDAQQQKYLSIIGRSGEHLLSLINDVLDMSKIESGRLTLVEKSFDLHSHLNSIKDMLQLRSQAKGLELRFDLAADLPRFIATDERKLRQILLNLIGNAIKFTQQGHVTLKATQEQINFAKNTTSLKFTVEDTGPGIAEDELDIIFEPFMQSETGRSSHEGTGLGLAISQKFAQLMGGNIKATSQLGKGSTFECQIEAKLRFANQKKPDHTNRRVSSIKPGQPSYRILIVDDHWENRQLIVKLLEAVGFETQEAANGQEAIHLWRSWIPHLILMDMQMPIMNGYEATQYIKSHSQEQQPVVIVALTASILEQEQSEILSAGCEALLTKPVEREVLLESISHYLGVQYLYTEIFEQKTSENHSQFIDEKQFASLSPEWHQGFYQAAAELNNQKMEELIAQLPSAHHGLAETLRQRVARFDFDYLMALSQRFV